MSLALTLVACGRTGSQPEASPTAAAQTPTSSALPGQSTPTATGVPKPALPLTTIRMLNATTGWALTAQSILKTTDGGVHWQDVTPGNAGLNQSARGNFLDGQLAWVAIPPQTEGPGIGILYTTDGGQNWQRSTIADPQVAYTDVPHFLNAQEGWLEASSTPGAGHAGSNIWQSTDGGQSWTKIASNNNASGLALGYVTGISFRDAQTGIATGNLGAGGDNTLPSISITQDGGKTWQTQSLPHLLGGYEGISNNTQPPVFFGNTIILPVNITTSLGDRFVLYRSETGGRVWFQTNVVPIHADNTYVLDGNHAWATDTKSGQLYNTSDGGNHWSATSSTPYNLKALSFTDANTGWGISSSALLYTTDGGKTWQPISYSIQ